MCSAVQMIFVDKIMIMTNDHQMKSDYRSDCMFSFAVKNLGVWTTHLIHNIEHVRHLNDESVLCDVS